MNIDKPKGSTMKTMRLGLAVLAAAGSMTGLAACGGSSARSDSQVASDLTQLLLDKTILGNVQLCTHSSGNSYTCKVTGTDNGTVFVSVTDDGKSIVEQGL